MSATPLLSRDLFLRLKEFIDFPERCISATVVMSLESVAEVECKFHPTREIEVTSLDSSAREFELDQTVITKRYRLVEIEADQLGKHSPPAPHPSV